MTTGYDLLAIYRQNAEYIRYRRERIPTDCPNDGTPLEPGPNGERHCRHDGWQYPRDWTAEQTQ